MITRIGSVDSRLFLGALASAGAAALALIAVPMCDSQPLARCQVDSLTTVAAYVPVGPPTGTGCANWVPPTLQAGTTGGGCGTNGCQAATPNGAPDGGPIVIGEVFGMESYFPSPNDPNVQDEPGSMAIQLGYAEGRIQNYQNNYLPLLDGGLSDYPYTDANPQPAFPPPTVMSPDHPYAWGPFDTVHPVNGICTVSHMTGSNLVYPALPDLTDAGLPPAPQTSIDYEWRNVRVLLDETSGSIGQQVFADLTITQDGCSQSFHVSLLAPQTSCNGTDDAGNPIADQSQCNPGIPSTSDNYPIITNAATQTQVYGSGLPSGVPVTCANIYPPAAPNDAGATGATPDFECLPNRTGP
jgi:hypothetical protein